MFVPDRYKPGAADKPLMTIDLGGVMEFYSGPPAVSNVVKVRLILMQDGGVQWMHVEEEE